MHYTWTGHEREIAKDYVASGLYDIRNNAHRDTTLTQGERDFIEWVTERMLAMVGVGAEVAR